MYFGQLFHNNNSSRTLFHRRVEQWINIFPFTARRWNNVRWRVDGGDGRSPDVRPSVNGVTDGDGRRRTVRPSSVNGPTDGDGRRRTVRPSSVNGPTDGDGRRRTVRPSSVNGPTDGDGRTDGRTDAPTDVDGGRTELSGLRPSPVRNPPAHVVPSSSSGLTCSRSSSGFPGRSPLSFVVLLPFNNGPSSSVEVVLDSCEREVSRFHL